MDSLDFLSLSETLDMVVTLYARATIRYILEDDRLIIRRAGSVRMEIPYRDMDLIEYIDDKASFFGPERLYRLFLLARKVLRITIRRNGDLKYVLINPLDPDRVIRTWYWAKFPDEAQAQGAQRLVPYTSRVV